jgi:phosphatidylinositol-3-phosphatase
MNRRSSASVLKAAAAVVGILAFSAGPARGGEGSVPGGVPHLDHVFVIVMENHAYGQIVGNPSSPFMNSYMRQVNASTNYFAVAHPSLTNYLELVGGSNFGVLNDNSPDWHNGGCTPNIVSGTSSYDVSSSPPVCPIAGSGTDAATPVFDTTNEITPPDITSVTEIDGVQSIPAASTVGKTIGDQLAERGLNWRSYQESLPPTGADRVNNSDGYYSDVNPIANSLPAETQTLINLYAVKHNPFAYFRSVQEGGSNGNGLSNTVGFSGLYADLASGQVPSFSFIVPNQCNDQHGRGNAGPLCDFDPSTTGTQEGLNPSLIYQGDLTIKTIVQAIHSSPAWSWGHNAIVVVWDENDYSATPNTNQVVLTVETNYGVSGVQSNTFYTHFSLLKSIEAGFGLPCLNHACDANVPAMTDLFAASSPADVRPAPPARFTASVTWSASNGNAGSGNLTYLTTDTRGFWFFSPDNLDLVVKVVDGRAVNGKFWVFYGSLTTEQFTLTVTDTVTGATKTYTGQGENASGADTSAF